MKTPGKILFFDGECTLCNRFIDFLIRRLPSGKIYFAPLQGKTSDKYLPASDRFHSVLYLRDGQVLRSSTAALIAINDIGGLWRMTKVLLLVPRPLRDQVYRSVAKNRFRWFGKQSCRIPTQEEAAYFLE